MGVLLGRALPLFSGCQSDLKSPTDEPKMAKTERKDSEVLVT